MSAGTGSGRFGIFAMQDDDGFFGYFGYGSLVNRATLAHDHVSAHPVRLSGWRRHWQGRDAGDIRDVALLSVRRCERTVVDGILVIDRISNLASLDEREIRYDRVAISADDLEFTGGARPAWLPSRLYLYEGRPVPADPDRERLIQSYVDTVMHGFLNEHGEAGVLRFMETTDGFGRAIIRDRHEPRYPRATRPAVHHLDWFDRLLKEAGVRFPD